MILLEFGWPDGASSLPPHGPLALGTEFYLSEWLARSRISGEGVPFVIADPITLLRIVEARATSARVLDDQVGVVHGLHLVHGDLDEAVLHSARQRHLTTFDRHHGRPALVAV